jgi:dienelactone hydrolase
MVHSERIAYEVQGVEMVGYLAMDETAGASIRPGVLLLHEGGGQDDNVRARANRLAALGYVAFALDYLGGGTQHPLAEAQARLGALFEDPAGTGEMALAGYRVLTAQPGVDGDRLAAAGFCFGGVMALELARAGVPLRAAVGFHPGFADPRPDDSARITASVLMMCGAEDPVVSAEARRRFEEEMREAAGRLATGGLRGVGHELHEPGHQRPRPPSRVRTTSAPTVAPASMLALLDEAFA